jgi:hypothetical protein
MNLPFIPNSLEIAIDLACPQTLNTGGFEIASGLAPPELGAGGRLGKMCVIIGLIWYYIDR